MKFKSPYIAFSAPSGAGKTTIVRMLNEKYHTLKISVSATTRLKRADEVDGKAYYFMDKENFLQGVKDNKFLEYEEVHDNYYGTLKEKVDEIVEKGNVVLFDIDVNGALSIKKQYPSAILIFIKPPSEQELVNRLQKRESETDASIKKRLSRLNFEYKAAEKFDYIVVNDSLEDTIMEIESLIIDENHA